MEYFILPSLESVLLHNLHHFARQYIAIIKFNNPNKKGFKKVNFGMITGANLRNSNNRKQINNKVVDN